MQLPLELTFRDVERTPALEALIRRKVRHLERFCDYITSCRVSVERPHKRKHTAGPYHVRIDLKVPPGHELVAAKDPPVPEANNLRTVIDSAFMAAERQLKELVQRQRGDVKVREEPRALVERLFPEEGYGFLRTLTGEQVYFHRNSLVGAEFDRLVVGTEVRYAAAQGMDGPQASTVQPVRSSKPGERVVDEGGATLP